MMLYSNKLNSPVFMSMIMIMRRVVGGACIGLIFRNNNKVLKKCELLIAYTALHLRLRCIEDNHN
jgi:hypothetical protein